MKNLKDLRDLGDHLTAEDYRNAVKKCSADFIIVTPTQWAYLEQTTVPSERTILQMPYLFLSLGGKSIIRIRKDVDKKPQE